MCGRWVTKLRFHDFDLGNEACHDESIDLNNYLLKKIIIQQNLWSRQFAKY